MSPEQAQGIKGVDSRSDLWSLAVIVFQCVTGRLPFESEALGDLLVKIIVSPIPTPSDVHRGVPAGFDTWWRKAADRNPEGRFQTAKEFATSLEMALGTSSVTDVNIDRAKLQKLGGGTAMMPSGPNVPAPHMSTPHPGMQSGPQMPMMQTPPGAMHTPQPVGMATANPVVAETPLEMPKKGPPLGLLIGAGAGLLAVVGLVLGLVAMSGKKANAGTGDALASASAAATTASAPASATAEAKATAIPTEVASAKPPEPEASATATASAVAHTTGKAGAAGVPIAGKGQPSQPATKPTQPTQPATKPGGTRPPGGGMGGLGF
jgi:serine/threonine-protein kinase